MERTVIHFGSVAAVIGAIIFMIANITHPRSPDIESTAAQIETVASSAIWVTDHLLLLFGGLMIFGGLMALRYMISSGPAAAWAKLGYAGAVVSTSVWTVLMALDGIASKVVHDAWADASLGEKAVALRIAEMMEEIDIALFSAYIIVFFGITFFFYGLAVAESGVFPRRLGQAAMILASASCIVGIVQAYTGLSVLVTNMLFASLSSFLVFWVLLIGIMMWRRIRVLP